MDNLEAQYQRTKWRLVAAAMESAGATKYSNAFIQKKYEEMSRKRDMLSSPIEDDDCSEGSVFDIVHHEDNVARRRRPGADSITPNLQARSDKSHVDRRADLTQVLPPRD